MENWTAESLMALVGVVLSLAFAYIPYAKDWYEQMQPQHKPLFMAGLLALVSVAYVLVTCKLDWACVQANAGEAVSVFVAALIANMTTYQYAVKQFKSPRASASVYFSDGFINFLNTDNLVDFADEDDEQFDTAPGEKAE